MTSSVAIVCNRCSRILFADKMFGPLGLGSIINMIGCRTTCPYCGNEIRLPNMALLGMGGDTLVHIFGGIASQPDSLAAAADQLAKLDAEIQGVRSGAAATSPDIEIIRAMEYLIPDRMQRLLVVRVLVVAMICSMLLKGVAEGIDAGKQLFDDAVEIYNMIIGIHGIEGEPSKKHPETPPTPLPQKPEPPNVI